MTPRPPLCGLCHYPIRDGEAYEARNWGTPSGPPVPGVAHVPTCPGITTVPCPPCLQQLVQGAAEEPHECALVTHLAIDGGRLIMGGEEDCPCPHVDEESDALKAARAEARTRTEIRPPRTP